MKGFFRHKYLKPVFCLGVGAILLTAGAFANYNNASGYSVCKAAVKDLLFETNFSAECRIEMKLDGETMEGMESSVQFNGGGNPSRHTVDKQILDIGTIVNESYEQDGMHINRFVSTDGTEESYVHQMNGSQSSGAEEEVSIIGTRNEVVEKAVNFVELVCDTLVGDLKNSFILREEKDGVRTYNVDLTGDQMPDLVSAGTSLVVSGVKEGLEEDHRLRIEHPEYYLDEDGNPVTDTTEERIYQSLFAGGDPVIESVHGAMTVDERDNPTMMEGVLRLAGWDADGQKHTLDITGEANLWDFGATEIAPVDIYSLPNLRINNVEKTVYVLDRTASQEEQEKVRKKADETASLGNVVEIVDTEGQHIITISGAGIGNKDVEAEEAAEADD